jgi:hypothetical protein
MKHTAADGKSEAFGGLTRLLLVLFVVLLIIDVHPWLWLALIATVAGAVYAAMGPFDMRAASPTYRLTRRAAPTLTQCGLQDTWVRCSQAESFVRSAKHWQPDSTLKRMQSAHGQLALGMRTARKWIVRRARALRRRK